MTPEMTPNHLLAMPTLNTKIRDPHVMRKKHTEAAKIEDMMKKKGTEMEAMDEGKDVLKKWFP